MTPRVATPQKTKRTDPGPTGLVRSFFNDSAQLPDLPTGGGSCTLPPFPLYNSLSLSKRLGGRVRGRNHSTFFGPTGVGLDRQGGWVFALAAALASTGCTPTDKTFALGTLTGAILGAAAALWRVRTARTAQPPVAPLDAHWRGVARGRR